MALRETLVMVVLPRDVQQALTLLERDPVREHSVKELAKACGVAPRTLQKHFRQFLGRTPVEVLRDIRLDLVRRELLLGQPGIRITEVALRAGFGNLGRFADAYRQRYGETPSETLRRAHKQAVQPVPPSVALPFASDRPVIAVLPFQFTGVPIAKAGDLPNEFAFALARLRWLSVGRPCDARYRLCGTVHASETGQLRIKVMLLSAENGRCLWADVWAGERTNAFTFEEQVAQRITSKLRNTLREVEIGRAWRKEPEELTAWEISMRALSRAVVQDTPSMTEGLELAEKAVELTPLDPLPLALAAWFQGMGASHSRHWAAKRVAARDLAERAARINATDPIAHVLLAGARVMYSDLDGSDFHLDRALALDGGCAWAWQRRGWNRLYRGNVGEAKECFQTAVELDPASPVQYSNSLGFGSVNFEMGRYADAARWWRRAMAESPAVGWANRFLAPALALSGQSDQARAGLHTLRTRYPDWVFGDGREPQPNTTRFNNQLANGFELIGVRPV